jgi:N-acetylglutamate synthase-like GNAT family acetyltransferase
MTIPPTLRDARDDDALDLIELIGGVFGEYVGCMLDVDGEIPELRRIASWAAEHRGEMWVAEREGRVVGCCGYSDEGDHLELKKLYVHRRERTSGLGSIFASRVEAIAAAKDKRFVDLWSDTRFTTAHRFYERRGYTKGPTRELGDKSATVEFYFRKDLEPRART